MSRSDDLRELIGEIQRHQETSRKMLDAMHHLVEEDLPRIGRTTTASVAAAGLLENYYTAIETVFVRVSQSFGNSLDRERWHSDLLHRMTLMVPDVRPAVISAETCNMLDELMRFRHFKRYYFQLDYDWNRLDYLMDLVERLSPRLADDLTVFEQYVKDLIARADADT